MLFVCFTLLILHAQYQSDTIYFGTSPSIRFRIHLPITYPPCKKKKKLFASSTSAIFLSWPLGVFSTADIASARSAMSDLVDDPGSSSDCATLAVSYSSSEFCRILMSEPGLEGCRYSCPLCGFLPAMYLAILDRFGKGGVGVATKSPR